MLPCTKINKLCGALGVDRDRRRMATISAKKSEAVRTDKHCRDFLKVAESLNDDLPPPNGVRVGGRTLQ